MMETEEIKKLFRNAEDYVHHYINVFNQFTKAQRIENGDVFTTAIPHEVGGHE